jgi:hypothetical protein
MNTVPPVLEAEKPVGKRKRTTYDAAYRMEAFGRVTQDEHAATWYEISQRLHIF